MAVAKKAANAAAIKAEVEEKEVTFLHGGKSYTVAPSSEWDLDALEAYEDGKVLSCIRALLGPDQWEKFKEDKPKNKDFEKFVTALFDATGADAGELPG